MNGARSLMILLDAMPTPGADGLVEIPIALTGHWKKGENEFSITKTDLAQMAANFRRRKNGEINIDYDHASEMPEVARGGPVPSAGRILKLKANGALMAGIKFTQRALEMIQAEEYRFVSPAIAWGVRDKVTGEDMGTALTSLALTNRPFLEELPQIKLSEIGSATHLADQELTMPSENHTERPNQQLARLARERATKMNIPLAEALRQIAREIPDLAEASLQDLRQGIPTAYFDPALGRFVPSGRPNNVAYEVVRLAEAKVKADGVRFAVALIEVCREHPELAARYRHEVMGLR